jgi:cysteinyl-tRNA synthetase
MHNGLVRIRSQSSKIKDAPGGENELQKMSKSLGNEIVVGEVLKKHDPDTLRFLLLSTHYRSPIEYSEDRLAELKRSLDNFQRFFERYQRITGDSFFELEAPRQRGTFAEGGSNREFLAEVTQKREAFLECMDDDFNTGGAVGVLNELLTCLNRFADLRKLEEPTRDAAAVADFRRGTGALKELSQILGLFSQAPKAPGGTNDQLVNGLLQLLVDLRAEARKAKNYSLGDQIRQRLAHLGVTLEDRPGGTGWRLG